MKAHLNKGLFSNYYLEELLPREEEFKIPLDELEKVLEEIKLIWDKKYLSSLNEPQLRKHFLDKIFEILGWTIDVEPPTPSGEWSKHPDYALFHSNEDLKIARNTTKEDYFKKALCIGEAKRWGRPLDRKLKEEKDPFEIQNPSLQVSRYLWLTGVKWGILTDGKYWRLYERETSKKLDIFYEIDLENLIENSSIEDFKYFYLFFQRNAFPHFVEKVYKGSIDYAEAVGEKLKENVYQALKVLAQGFLKTPGNNLQETHLKEIHDNSLILLYRLLFILYAEHRGLLPVGENRLYADSYSLDALKKEIAGKLDNNEPIAVTTHGYWSKLTQLFETINLGNSELEVPPYNGGLFDPDKYEFLERYRVGDLYIIKAIGLLSRSSDGAYIDYGSLEIRHLGSIYEGLLEYKLRIAEEDIVPIKEKGKNVFIPLDRADKEKKKIKEEEIIRKGGVYLATDKGERKATGSYYTPHYIVKYIVENTLGPLIEARRKKVSLEIQSLTEKIKRSRGYNREIYERELKKVEGNILDEILSIKVLDPAMGSGHFLVEATDFLARELLKALSGEPLEEHSKEMAIHEPSVPYVLKESDDEDIRWARREIVERCIFGVDLNPMAVELAKLSLWLYTVAKGKPLNFLAHHLKCGNSLIGAKVENLQQIPGKKKKGEETALASLLPMDLPALTVDLGLAVGGYFLIENTASETIEDVKKKDELYQALNKDKISKWRDLANIWTSSFFGVELNQRIYNAFSDYILGKGAQVDIKFLVEKDLNRALDLANEKKFFHWELEFPEVFFDHHGKNLANPGFSAVVGNPPYDVISEKEQGREVEGEKVFYLSQQAYNPSVSNKLNFYRLFISRSLEILKVNGMHGFIVPMALLADKQAKNLRHFLLEKNQFVQIEAFPQKDDQTNRVFYDAKLSTCMYVMKNAKPLDFAVRVHPGKDILENSPLVNVTYDQIKEFDRKNLSLPCHPNMTTQDFDLALKIFRACKGNILDNYASSQQGEINLTSHSTFLSKEPIGQVVLRGAHVDRYEFNEEPKQGVPMYVDVQNYLGALGKETRAYDYKYCRIGYQRGAAIDNWRRIITTIIKKDNFCSDTINYIVNPRLVKLHAILSLLNSSLWEWRFRLTSTNNHVNAYEIDSMPIPYISFITPKADREQLLHEVTQQYQKGNPDTLLYFVESRLMKEHQPDIELVKKHNSELLNKDWQIPEGALWEQSDVVHDILAYLAEQMIEINKDKQKEIKGFLEWLENQLKIQSDAKGNKGIEALTGKTQIKNYLGDYQKGKDHLSFKKFWNILEKNKNRIQANLKSRELFETIKTEYDKSLSRLLPLKEKLRKTDWLIDQIVCKLYGLTEEEIKTVESNK